MVMKTLGILVVVALSLGTASAVSVSSVVYEWITRIVPSHIYILYPFRYQLLNHYSESWQKSMNRKLLKNFDLGLLWLYVWYSIRCIHLGLGTARQAGASWNSVWSWLDLGSCVHQGAILHKKTWMNNQDRVFTLPVSLGGKQTNCIWTSTSMRLWIKQGQNTFLNCDRKCFIEIQICIYFQIFQLGCVEMHAFKV